MNTLEAAQIHRYGEHVALYIGGATVYLTPKQAMTIGRALVKCAYDVRDEPNFGKAKFKTVEVAG